MDGVRAVKQNLTGATTSIDRARDLLDTMAASVRRHLEDIDRSVGAAQSGD